MSNAPKRKAWVEFGRALIVVVWIYLWIIPLVVALEINVKGATVVLVTLIAAFWWYNVQRPLRSKRRLAAVFRLRPWRPYAGWITLAAVAQVALAFVTLLLHEQLAEWRFLPKLPTSPDLIPPRFLESSVGPLAMTLAVVVATPLIEEFGFRGRMQYRLERTVGVMPAIFFTAVVFCLLHGLIAATHHMPYALFTGWLVWRTGSIWPAVYMHAINNGVVLGLIYLTQNWPSQKMPAWHWTLTLPVGFLASVALLATAWRIHVVATDAPMSARHPVSDGLAPALRG
jgi:membrane protease YdiL (CAAX protease family)